MACLAVSSGITWTFAGVWGHLCRSRKAGAAASHCTTFASHIVRPSLVSRPDLCWCAGLWGLDDLDAPEVAEVLARAEAAPDDFVLKPQREGGGNNLYGPELAARLRERKGLAAFILMQRIRPPVNMCALLHML